MNTRTSFIFICFLITYNLFSLSETKKALIIGISGQDGSYLAEFLLEKNYEVYGIKRSSKIDNSLGDCNLRKIRQVNSIIIYEADLTDFEAIYNIIASVMPDEIYNLAAQSSVSVSFNEPVYSMNINAIGVFNILEAIKKLNLVNKTKFFQASTSEIYGKGSNSLQNENSTFYPMSPYAISKLCAYWAVVNYRDIYGIFACNGILFNHESPRRGLNFVTRKITRTIAEIKYGLKKRLVLGNLDAKRDWGYAKDYVKAMWLMLQQNEPDDYIVATGEVHSVRELVELTFKESGIDIIWQGSGVGEVGIDKKTNKVLVKVDSRFYRPIENCLNIGDYSKARKALKWNPKTNFEQLIKIMVNEDLENLKLENIVKC